MKAEIRRDLMLATLELLGSPYEEDAPERARAADLWDEGHATVSGAKLDEDHLGTVAIQAMRFAANELRRVVATYGAHGPVPEMFAEQAAGLERLIASDPRRASAETRRDRAERRAAHIRQLKAEHSWAQVGILLAKEDGHTNAEGAFEAYTADAMRAAARRKPGHV